MISFEAFLLALAVAMLILRAFGVGVWRVDLGWMALAIVVGTFIW